MPSLRSSAMRSRQTPSSQKVNPQASSGVIVLTQMRQMGRKGLGGGQILARHRILRYRPLLHRVDGFAGLPIEHEGHTHLGHLHQCRHGLARRSRDRSGWAAPGCRSPTDRGAPSGIATRCVRCPHRERSPSSSRHPVLRDGRRSSPDWCCPSARTPDCALHPPR